MGDSDSKYLEYIYSRVLRRRAADQLQLSVRRGGGFGRGNMPTYASLQFATDSAGQELGVPRHRGELPLAQGFRIEESARSRRRRFRRPQGDSRRRPVSQGPPRGRRRLLHVERRAVSLSAGRRVGALLRATWRRSRSTPRARSSGRSAADSRRLLRRARAAQQMLLGGRLPSVTLLHAGAAQGVQRRARSSRATERRDQHVATD